MSSSGLIYAVIVGAWAAYLVPMWLRRQDELNEARPTERFSTAIRLLSGKAGMERRYAKDTERRAEEGADGDETGEPASEPAPEPAPDARPDHAVDVRAFADPLTMAGARARQAVPAARPRGERNKRAQALARRRRTTMVLFLAFTCGAIVAAVGGLTFLWAPGAPAVLLSVYIVHLRRQERRRFIVVMDRRRAEIAAQRLRERRGAAPTKRAPVVRGKARPAADGGPVAGPRPHGARGRAEAGRGNSGRSGHRAEDGTGGDAGPEPGAPERAHDHGGPHGGSAADRRALVERTDHAEWIDQQRGRLREQPEGEGWDPVPVPLPTYVSAPVAPRTPRGVDLGAADAWSAARSSTAGPAVPAEHTPGRENAAHPPEQPRTPLFDQCDESDRPRAANE